MKIKKTLLVTVFLLISLPMFSQYYYYYGKNRVQDYKFNWKHVETKNFNLHYYTDDKDLVDRVARAAQLGYNKISNYLNIKVKKKIPLIFFSTHIDFEQNNIAGYMPAGVIAFAESTNYRVVIQGDLAFNDLVKTIVHELAHVFEYEILGRSLYFNPPPTWVMEGFSDLMLGDWDPFDLLTVRDAALSENIPELQKNGQIRSAYSGGRSNYNFGHLIFEFIEHKFGRRGVKKFLFSLRGGGFFRGFGGGRRNLLRVFDYTPKRFNHEFGKWVRERFKKYLLKENPADYSYMIGPDFPYAYSFSHDVSPSGEMLAVLTVNYRKRTLDIILISMRDGKVVKRITPGFTRKYDWINLKFNPTDGNSFAWNKDSNVIAFFARKEWTNYLVLINVLNGKIIKKIKIKDIQDPTSPQYLPGKNMLYFTGQESTRSYLYSMDLDTGKASKLTDGNLFIKAAGISPDGKKIIYSAKSGEYLKLYLAPIENPGMAKKITDGDYNDITPSFSNDGKRIFYSSDELGSYNINALDLESKTLSRYSDVRTGNFFPVEIPSEEGDEKQVVISSFYRNTFSLYKKDVSTPFEKRSIEFEAPKIIAAKTKEKEKTAEAKEEVKIVDKGKYKPFKKFYVRSLPPIGISLGTDGGIFGYSYLTMTDLLGDHSFTFYLYSYYGYRSYQLTYLNRRNRLNFYARLFGFKDVYYPNYNLSYYTTIRSMFGGEVGFFYPFNRAYRAELTTSLYSRDEDSDDLFLGVSLPYGQYFDGMASSVKFALVGETTRFQNYGPNRGHTFRVSYEKFIKYGSNFMDAYTVEADFRKYIPLDNYSLLAFRLSGFKSGGPNAMLTWTGGDNNFRSADFRRLTGNNYFLFNAEFRFPIIHLALTPIGVIGPVRGVFFFDVGGVWYNEDKFRFLDEGQGLKLKDGRGSYGFGVEFWLFGYPMHVEWVWKTNLDKKAFYGVNFWIGFDF